MQLSNDMLKQIVCKVLESLNEDEVDGACHTDPSGIISVKAAEVRPEPFDTGKAGDKVFASDIIGAEESERLGCGIMEIDQSKFELTLKYDEIDYIIEGCLDVIIDGRTVRVEKGDVIFIPKNSRIQFSTSQYTRFMYVVYPG